MTPQQKHYHDIMAKRGWFNQDGSFRWPETERDLRERVRQVFGLELVSTLDDLVEHAEDELFGTFEASWATKDRVSEEATRRRAIFACFTEEQKAAALDLMHHFGRMALFSFCCHLDQFCGGVTMSIAGTDPKKPAEQLQFQPGDFLDMHDEQLQWLEDFSLIYGNDA
jgi:hypothetical protein